MVKAVYKFTSGWLMFLELLTLVIVMLLVCDFKTVTCAEVNSRGFTGLDKLYHSHNSESHVSALDDTEQRDGTIEEPNSPTTVSIDSDNVFVSQEQRPLSDFNRLTAGRNHESTSVMRHTDFRTTLPHFFHMVSGLSHRFVHQLEQPATSDRRAIKEDVTSAGTPVTKVRRQTEEKHKKFESPSKTVSRKALKVPPVHPETSELNVSFQSEKWPFNHSENISFLNSSAFTNVKEIYERWGIPVLYEEEGNEHSETILSSNRLISDFISNKSSFVEYSNHQTQVNELSNGTSSVGRPIKVINYSDSTQNEWSPAGERSQNSNVGSEINDSVIKSVDTNDLGINTTTNSITAGAVMSLNLAASETDEKLAALSSSVNTNATVRGTPDIFAEKVNEVRLDNNKNGSVTQEIFGVVKSTQLVELNDRAVYSEIQRSDSENQSTRAAENGVDETSGVVENGSDVTVLNAEAGDSIESELAGGEINGSRVEKFGGYSDGKTRKSDVERGTVLVPSTNIESNVMSNNLPHNSVYNGTLNAGVPETQTVSSEINGGNYVTDTAGFKQDVRSGSRSALKHGSVKSSRIRGEILGRLRVLKTRDAEITRLYNDNVSEVALEIGQNNSGFAQSLYSNKTNHRNRQQRYFPNNTTKDVENLSAGSSFVHQQSEESSDALKYSGKDMGFGPQFGSDGSGSGASAAYLDKKGVQLTENEFREVPALTSVLFTNGVNGEGTEYLQDRSENVTFIPDAFSNSTDNKNRTTSRDIQQMSAVTVSDKKASQGTENHNSSKVSYEFVPINETSDNTAVFNFELYNISNSYNVSFSTSDFTDIDEGIWSTLTPVLSTPESPISGSISNHTGTSFSNESTVSLGNGSVSDGESGWPVKVSAEVAGDVILGGLMMVHEREDNTICGPIMPQGGIQALETMLYTLDVLNKAPDMIPNVTIGAHILDDCDKDTYGLEMAVDFIKGREIDFNSVILLLYLCTLMSDFIVFRRQASHHLPSAQFNAQCARSFLPTRQ